MVISSTINNPELRNSLNVVVIGGIIHDNRIQPIQIKGGDDQMAS